MFLLTNNHLGKTWGLHPWWFWFQGMRQYLYWSSWTVLFDIYGYICSRQMLPSPRNFHPKKAINRLASIVSFPNLIFGPEFSPQNGRFIIFLKGSSQVVGPSVETFTKSSSPPSSPELLSVPNASQDKLSRSDKWSSLWTLLSSSAVSCVSFIPMSTKDPKTGEHLSSLRGMLSSVSQSYWESGSFRGCVCIAKCLHFLQGFTVIWFPVTLRIMLLQGVCLYCQMAQSSSGVYCHLFPSHIENQAPSGGVFVLPNGLIFFRGILSSVSQSHWESGSFRGCVCIAKWLNLLQGYIVIWFPVTLRIMLLQGVCLYCQMAQSSSGVYCHLFPSHIENHAPSGGVFVLPNVFIFSRALLSSGSQSHWESCSFRGCACIAKWLNLLQGYIVIWFPVTLRIMLLQGVCLYCQMAQSSSGVYCHLVPSHIENHAPSGGVLVLPNGSIFFRGILSSVSQSHWESGSFRGCVCIAKWPNLLQGYIVICFPVTLRIRLLQGVCLYCQMA